MFEMVFLERVKMLPSAYTAGFTWFPLQPCSACGQLWTITLIHSLLDFTEFAYVCTCIHMYVHVYMYVYVQYIYICTVHMYITLSLFLSLEGLRKFLLAQCILGPYANSPFAHLSWAPLYTNKDVHRFQVAFAYLK